jgi:hypothetical protein
MRPLVRQHGEHPRWKWARWRGVELQVAQRDSDIAAWQLLSVYGKVAGVVPPELIAPTEDEECQALTRELEEMGIGVDFGVSE